MKTKPHIFILLAVLISVGVIVSPVCAYTLQAHYDMGTSSTARTGIIGQLRILNNTPAGFDGITKIDIYANLSRYDNTTLPESGSATCILQATVGGLHKGNATVSWNIPGVDSGVASKGSLNITITDFADSTDDVTLTHWSGAYVPTEIRGKNQVTTSFDIPYFTQMLTTGPLITGGEYWIYDGLADPPVAGFSCVPTSQVPGSNVVCTDSSTNIPTYWHWMYGINGQDETYWGTSSSQNLTFTESFPALYTVKLFVNNTGGEDWENKTDYIHFNVNATPNNCNLPVTSGYIRTVFQCLDSQSSGAVDGCDIQLRDNEANAWSNATGVSDGVWCIDTFPAHSINAYAQATGYSSTTRLNLPALNQIYGMYYLLLIPGYVPSAPDGSVYLYATVNDYDTHLNLAGATVTASWSGGSSTSSGTDAHGVAVLTVKNSTSVYLTASKSGYSSSNKVVSTSPYGPDSAMISLHKQTVTAIPTATTGPGGTIPTTIGPGGTPGPGGTMAPGYTNNQAQMGLDWLGAHLMDLIMLCFIVTLVGLTKMMAK